MSMGPVNAMRIAPGYYWTPGGYEIMHDDGAGGTGYWVVCRRTPGGMDNPLAFCATLREACHFVGQLKGS
jgi:hypothetical protein